MWRALRFGLLAVTLAVVSLIAVAAQHSRTATGSPATAQPPVLAVAGASFSAGVGATDSRQAWPELLAHRLGWRVVVNADPGAGYLAPGQHALGPMKHLIGGLHLAADQPRMVIVQAGFNDIGMPARPLADNVRAAIGQIRAQVPTARIGVVTVFTRGGPTPAARSTDATIVAAARAADPGVYIFDPIAEQWVYPTVYDHLHPSPAGHRWIADRLATDFRRDGLAAPAVAR